METAGDLVEALVPFAALDRLAAAPGVQRVREPQSPYPDSPQAGEIKGPRLESWQWAGYTGDGVDVAIIDSGFADLPNVEARGDLPAGLTVSPNYCSGSQEQLTLHGTDVAQIVHAAAPGAQLHLICIDDDVDLALAEQWAEANGIEIVSHSMSWFNTSRGDGTGGDTTPEGIVRRAAEHGILWVNSAGDMGNSHWGGTFANDIVQQYDGWHQFDQNKPFQPWIDIRRSDYVNQICATLRLDEWPNAQTDLDLYLLNPAGTVVAQSTNAQTGTQPPLESLCYSPIGGFTTDTYHIVVRKVSGSATPYFDLFTPGLGMLAGSTARGSITEPASSASAFAVGDQCGRVYFSNQYLPSNGPTIDGRIKPDIAAPSHADGFCSNANRYDPFGGTSLSAPHVVGAAALVMQKYPDKTGAQVRSFLVDNAWNPNIVLPNNELGNGYLHLPVLPPTVNSFDQVPYMTAGERALYFGAFLDRATSATLGDVPLGVASDDYIDALDYVVPDNAVAGVLHVTTPEGTASSAGTIGVAARVDSFQPPQACDHSIVTVTGGGFLSTSAVTVAGVPVRSFAILSATQLRLVLGHIASGGPIQVETPGGIISANSGGSFLNFLLTPLPMKIKSVSVTKAAFGSQVRVVGANFKCLEQVTLGNFEVLDHTESPDGTTLTFVVPEGAPSGVVRIAGNTAGAIVASKKAISVVGYPAIAKLKPVSGSPGAVVAIGGVGLTAVTAVNFGGVPTTFTTVGDGTINAVVPLGAGTGPVTIVTPLGTFASAINFTVLPPPKPSIKSAKPSSGSVGTVVTLAGSGFFGATAVSLAGVSAAFTVKSASAITVTVPAGAASGVFQVTAPGGTATSKSFTVS